MTRHILSILLILSTLACGEPAPVVNPDASVFVPEPVAIATTFPDAWAAVVEVTDTVCPAPRTQVLEFATYQYVTGFCASGACTPECAVCSSGEVQGDVLVLSQAAHEAVAAREAYAYVITCEGREHDANELRMIVNRLD
jgi:hypothetical protein